MTESVEEPAGRREGRVRLRRSGLMAVPAAAIAGGLVVLTAQGLIAAQFAISGIPFVVTADSLHGEGFEQWGYLDQTADGSPNLSDSNGQQVVMVSAIKDATLHNLCQSINLGGVYLVLTAGTGGTPVTAHNLVVDSDQLSATRPRSRTSTWARTPAPWTWSPASPAPWATSPSRPTRSTSPRSGRTTGRPRPRSSRCRG